MCALSVLKDIQIVWSIFRHAYAFYLEKEHIIVTVFMWALGFQILELCRDIKMFYKSVQCRSKQYLKVACRPTVFVFSRILRTGI